MLGLLAAERVDLVFSRELEEEDEVYEKGIRSEVDSGPSGLKRKTSGHLLKKGSGRRTGVGGR